MKLDRITRLTAAAREGLPEDRIVACDRLVRDGYFETAEGPLNELAQIPSTAAEARKLLAVCRQLQRWGIVGQLKEYRHKAAEESGEAETLPDFKERSGALIARRPGADKVIFVFTGAARQIWVSLHLLHQLLPKEGCDIVYLRDDEKCGYLTGVSGFGESYEGALAAMQDFVASLGSPRVFCIGSSGGGYAALRYGLDLKAESVLAFSPTTDTSDLPELLKGTGLEGLYEQSPFVVDDIRNLYQAAAVPPRVILVYGERHARDACECERMAALPTVRLVPIVGYDRHDVISQTIATGLFPELIKTLLEG